MTITTFKKNLKELKDTECLKDLLIVAESFSRQTIIDAIKEEIANRTK